ncbi:MAG: transposase [Planctomycetes bacterium]|nr:transposase [Planctomycetota bacterium]
MDCIVNEPDPVCGPFLDKFADLWSRPNQPQCFAAYVRGLLAQVERKNVEAISRRTIGQPYQGLRRFLGESPKEIGPRGCVAPHGPLFPMAPCPP